MVGGRGRQAAGSRPVIPLGSPQEGHFSERISQWTRGRSAPPPQREVSEDRKINFQLWEMKAGADYQERNSGIGNKVRLTGSSPRMGLGHGDGSGVTG